MNHDVLFSLTTADPRTFGGTAFTGIIAEAETEVPLKLYYVRFEPEARTFWHAHQGSQILVVTTGRCRYQRHGGPVRELAQGESVRFEAGERHWHGAAANEPAEHIAVNLDIRETDWFEEVVL